MKLILHIGLPKCGSTTIQRSLRNNTGYLRAEGYAVSEYFSKGHARLSHGYKRKVSKLKQAVFQIENMNEAIQGFRREGLARLEQEISEKQDCHSYILSDEGFSVLDRTGINSFCDDIQDFFDDVQIVVYVRHQVDLILSGYSTKLLSGDVRTVQTFFENQYRFDSPYYYFDRTLSAWEEFYSRRAIRANIVNANSLKNGNLLHDFLSGCGVSEVQIQNLALADRQNKSMNGSYQELLRWVNESTPLRCNGRQNELKELMLGKLHEVCTGKPILPSREIVQKLIDRYHESNVNFQKNYMGKNSNQLTIDADKYPNENIVKKSDEEAFLSHTLWTHTKNLIVREKLEKHFLGAKCAIYEGKKNLFVSCLEDALNLLEENGHGEPTKKLRHRINNLSRQSSLEEKVFTLSEIKSTVLNDFKDAP